MLFWSARLRAVALTLIWAVMTLFLAAGVQAGGDQTQATIVVRDAYMRTSGGIGKTGAAFMVIENLSGTEDRLLSASSRVARKTEIHTHMEDANGMMMMRPVVGGLVIPAGGSHALKRGGDHLMMMGLNRALVQGDLVSFVLVFEHAGPVEAVVPVDQARKN